ncbi:BspA family leucine-rich repeat surface protein [Xylocopilactobacillus apis]|uniref:Surface protein n=1 Tax=Xylocopilactobacillus apis TaxID=2932183 RepID=A0AAU9DJQ2_9LACO|nr:BspA family leucine-rich repeat surface protein [Xylocopilactobacillus apis]BDR57012.1 hypothetical protein KIMC2_15740 [Xylocopilactobacillus apis]
MNKYIKRLGYILIVIVTTIIFGIGLSFKQESRAADFPQNTAFEDNISNKQSKFPLSKENQFKPLDLTSRIIPPNTSSTVVRYGNFRMYGVGSWNDVNKRSEVTLNWTAPANVSGGYHIERDTSSSFTTAHDVGTNYGKRFQILNVAPRQLYGPINAATSKWFEQWMKQTNSRGTGPVDMGLFDITTVSLDSYNANPNSILKNPNGTYKYDGIFFGAIDWNGYQDINETSYQATKAFGDTGRAITFGHDTIEGSADDSHGGDQHSGVPCHTYFNRFAPLLGLKVSPAYHFVGSNKLKVATQGSLTQQPYFMDPTQIFSVSPSHSYASYYQYNSGAIRWLKYDESSLVANHWAGGDSAVTYERDASGKVIADNNWYLVSKNNYAQIQTGHTTGQCTPQEAEIIFNMIYYTSSLNTSTTGKDITVTDNAAPNLPSVASSSSTATSVSLNINAIDNSTDYYFRGRADTSVGNVYSDIIKVPVLSGIKGYVYSTDTNPSGAPAVNRDPATNRVTNINLLPSGGTSAGTLTFNRSTDYNKYVHVIAIDNNNNVSAVKTISLKDYIWWTYGAGILTIYPHVLNADVDATIDSSDPNLPVVVWPWHQYKSQLTKAVISPGVSGGRSLNNIFGSCTVMTSIEGLTNLNTTNVEDYTNMFNYCKSLTSLNFSNFNTVKSIVMFRFMRHCENITSLTYGPNFITNNVQNFGGFYEGMHKMTTFDLSHINTSSAKAMTGMFGDCPNLKTLDLSRFDTSKVSDMRYMFEFDYKLEELDLSSFSGASLTSMYYMFKDDTALKRLKFSTTLNTPQLTDLQHTFENCSSLSSLDLSRFTTNPNTTNMDQMFNGMTKLWQLKLGANTKLSSITGLGNPTAGTPITDLDKPVPPNPQYYATNPQWREALTPTTVHAPTGAAKTAAQIAADSRTRTDTRTYVWDQIGTQTLGATPGTIDLGTHLGALKNKEYKSSAQNINVTDNRNVRTGKRWHVEAAVTTPFKLTTDSTKVIRGNPLYYHNTTTGAVTHLLSTAQTLHSEIATSTYQDVKNYPWTLSFKAGPSDIPKAGRYNATVTFTLVNDTP